MLVSRRSAFNLFAFARRIIAKGGSGGRGSSGHGISRGAIVRAVAELRMGEPLYILIGQAGGRATCKNVSST
jgi:hypothetical protein